MLRKVLVIICIIVLITGMLSGKADAESRDYTLDGMDRVPIPVTYSLKKVINNVIADNGDRIYFESAEEICIDRSGYVYVVDTGNNRVVKMTKDGELIDIFKEAGEKSLKGPRGIFVDDDGDMYITDPGNHRVVHLTESGEFVEEFTKPDSSMLGENFTFEPSKIAISPTGYIYVTRGQSLMIIDSYNRFRGYLGQSEIGFRLLDVILRRFASEEQKRAVIKRTAAVYTNFTLDDDGMIYATTLDHAEGEIKKLNSIGKNIYRKYSRGDTKKILDFLTKTTLTGKPFMFGERFNDEGEMIRPNFVDIAVDKNGIITTLEQSSGKVYQYDQEGNLLTVFGGKSDQKGMFDFPTSLDVDEEGNIYILDRVLNSVQVFEPTKFISLVHQAVNSYADGNYDEAYKIWDEVLNIDDNYPLAHVGMARALYKQKRYKEAMDEYTMADDRDGYSQAFTKYRHEIFREHFALVILSIVVIILVILFILKGIKFVSGRALHKFRMSEPDRMGTLNMMQFSLATILHPMETFEYIKRDRDRLNYIPTIVILGLLLVVRMLYIHTVHYPLADIDPTDANVLLETVRGLLPVLTWTIALFGITAVLDGEARYNEILVASSFCMLPYLLVHIPLPFLSRILGRDETVLYAVIINLSRIWTFMLIFISVKTLNDYMMAKSIGVTALSGVTMGLIWAVILLALVLLVQFYEFIIGIVYEIRMLFI
ncbi:MAG: tetratricopeptide repeat protein [Clostridiales bacterium]|nr:tetratricopeptide repeat protein [Clostridiales bacterium]